MLYVYIRGTRRFVMYYYVNFMCGLSFIQIIYQSVVLENSFKSISLSKIFENDFVKLVKSHSIYSINLMIYGIVVYLLKSIHFIHTFNNYKITLVPLHAFWQRIESKGMTDYSHHLTLVITTKTLHAFLPKATRRIEL